MLKSKNHIYYGPDINKMSGRYQQRQFIGFNLRELYYEYIKYLYAEDKESCNF